MSVLNAPVFKGVEQVGIIVDDLQAVLKKYVEEYGIGPWYIIKFGPENVKDLNIHGREKDYSMRLALCQIGNIQFELIEPLTESAYTEHNKKYGKGIIHHLKMKVDDYDGTLEFFESKGIKVLQSGNWEGKSRYANLATEEDLGFQAEVSVPSPDFKMPNPDYWYPS